MSPRRRLALDTATPWCPSAWDPPNLQPWEELQKGLRPSLIPASLGRVGWGVGRMTAGTVVITGGILAAVILLCIIAVLCYCRLQYYCCKKSREEDAEEEEDHDRPTSPGAPPCNACSSQALDGRGSLPPLTSEACSQPCGVAARHCATCSPYSSPFYIQTADMVPNGGGGERLSFAPMYYKEGGPSSLQLAAPQSYPVTWPCSGREAFTNPRAISTDV